MHNLLVAVGRKLAVARNVARIVDEAAMGRLRALTPATKVLTPAKELRSRCWQEMSELSVETVSSLAKCWHFSVSKEANSKALPWAARRLATTLPMESVAPVMMYSGFDFVSFGVVAIVNELDELKYIGAKLDNIAQKRKLERTNLNKTAV